MPDLSFQEKSVWGSLVALVACSGYYFAKVLGMIRADGGIDPVASGQLGISLLVALIVIEIVYHSVVAAASGTTESDERDRWIETRASRNGFVAIGIAVMGVVVHLLGAAYWGEIPYPVAVTPLGIANLLLLALVAAEVVKYVSQIVYYRAGG